MELGIFEVAALVTINYSFPLVVFFEEYGPLVLVIDICLQDSLPIRGNLYGWLTCHFLFELSNSFCLE